MARQPVAESWVGASDGYGTFSTASNWSAGLAPQSGDTLAIVRGSPLVLSAATGGGLSVHLGGTDPGAVPNLQLANATISASTTIGIGEPAQVSAAQHYARITATYRTVNDGTVQVGTNRALPSYLTVQINPMARFVNDPAGAVNVFDNGHLTVSGATFENDGTMSIVGGVADLSGVRVTGTGTITLDFSGVGGSGALKAGAVGAGETVDLKYGRLELTAPPSFAAHVKDFTYGGSSIVLDGIRAVSGSYANGILTVKDASGGVTQLHLDGNFSSSSFNIINTNTGAEIVPAWGPNPGGHITSLVASLAA